MQNVNQTNSGSQFHIYITINLYTIFMSRVQNKYGTILNIIDSNSVNYC